MGTLSSLRLLLAALFCSVLIIAMPITSAVASAPVMSGVAATLEAADEAPFAVAAGENPADEAEAVLQLDKTLLQPLLRYLLHELYSLRISSDAAPGVHPQSNSDCGQHASLSKGP